MKASIFSTCIRLETGVSFYCFVLPKISCVNTMLFYQLTTIDTNTAAKVNFCSFVLPRLTFVNLLFVIN